MGHELAIPRLQTECSSHSAIQLKSYCWEEVEFIQLVYCILIILSFLNCDWLLIRELQWLYYINELLVPVEKFSLRMPMMGHESATPRLRTECSSHWAIQLKSYCWEGAEFIQLVYCIILRCVMERVQYLKLSKIFELSRMTAGYLIDTKFGMVSHTVNLNLKPLLFFKKVTWLSIPGVKTIQI